MQESFELTDTKNLGFPKIKYVYFGKLYELLLVKWKLLFK